MAISPKCPPTVEAVLPRNILTKAKTTNKLATGKPILLFCENVSLYGVGESDGYDYWSQSITSGAHIAVAFGYLTINYYDANDALIRTDHHIEIATGWPGNNKCGYLNANDSSWLNSAYIVNIT